MILRRDAQANINRIRAEYSKISAAAGLYEKPERMTVAGFRAVKTADQLKNPAERGIIFTDKQVGKKAGKHMREWNLDPTKSEDRTRFIDITNEICNEADEVRMVQWNKDKETGKRTVEVRAYIKGNDVVLVDVNGNYITTMKDGINNTRVKSGRKV